MPFDVIDLFSGSAGTLLEAHTPDVGAAWSTGNSYKYTGSVVKLDGSGGVYSDTSNPSLYTTPTTLAGTVHHIIAVYEFLTDLGAGFNVNLPIYTGNNGALVDNRVAYENGVWTLSGLTSASAVTQNFAFPASGTKVSIRITPNDSASPRTVLVEQSTDGEVTWTTMFGGSHNIDTSNTNPLTPGIWFGAQNSPTTGIKLHNLRVAQSTVNPTLAVSPTTFTAGSSGTLTLTGTGTGWKAATPGAPTFSVSGGTGASVSGQVIAGYNAATLTLNPGSAAGTLTITDPSGGTATVTVNSSTPAPTTLTVTGASSGTDGTPLTLTATLDHAAGAGGITYTPTASVVTAVFSPNPVVFAQGDTAKTFTITASTAGTSSVGGSAS
jgi:hypothetical protein